MLVLLVAMLAGSFSPLGATLGTSGSKPKSIGVAENLCTGMAHCGIKISTCLALTLEESDLRLARGNPERLVLLETIVEVLEELYPEDVQGLSRLRS